METISLSGSWMLEPLDSTSSSVFKNDNKVEYNNSNSVYTILKSLSGEEELEELRKLNYVISRSFNFEKKDNLRSVLLARGAKSAKINGMDATSAEITDLLKDGENTISLIVSSSFSSPVEILRSQDGVGYGAHLRAKRESGEWKINAELDYEAFTDHERVVKLSLLKRESSECLRFKTGRHKYIVSLSIPENEVELWSIRGDGKQIVYAAELFIGDAKLIRHIAFREIEAKDGALYVNGRETFLMGAVWPIEILSDQKRYDMMLSSAAWANMNTVLIEEGHESHAFYNTCDRLGLIALHKDELDESFTYHPSYVAGDVKIDIFKAEVHDSDEFISSALDAINLERWTLKTRSDNSNHGVIYSNLLSTVREDGTWRPSHYAARRFFADLVPVMFRENDKLMVFVSNDSDKEEEVDISIKFMTYSGQKRTKRVYSVIVPAHQAVKIQEIDLSRIDRKNEFVYIKLRTFSLHRELTLLLDDFEKCHYERADITWRFRKINSKSYAIRLLSNKPAFAVHLEMEGVRGNFTDSFFEVRPSGEKRVIFNSEEDLDEDELKKRLRIYDFASAILA